jgi:hypothetical protein
MEPGCIAIREASFHRAAFTCVLISTSSRSAWTVRGRVIESFNGKFRAARLNAHWFMSLDDAIGALLPIAL